MKTHMVIDMMSLCGDYDVLIVGAYSDCVNFMRGRQGFGLEIVPLTVEQFKIHNP